MVTIISQKYHTKNSTNRWPTRRMLPLIILDFDETWHNDRFDAQTDHREISQVYEK